MSGNHEHLNLIHDFVYVNPSEIAEVGGVAEWKARLSTQSPIGQFLRSLPMARIIGSTLCVHAGILPEIARRFDDIVSLNEQFHEFVTALSRGDGDIDPMAYYASLSANANSIESLLVGNDGPLWTRYFESVYYDETMLRRVFAQYSAHQSEHGQSAPLSRSAMVEWFMCGLFKQLLQLYDVKRIVSGHNVQSDGKVKVSCEGALWAIDVGMAAHYGGNMAALEIDIETDLVRVVTDPRNPPHALVIRP